MHASEDVTRMRLVGGNLGLDFINTRSGPPHGIPDDDLLAGYDGLVSWAAYAGVVSEKAAAQLRRRAHDDPHAADAAFARSRRIRDDLDEVFRALADGRETDDAVLSRLREDESEALRSAHCGPGPSSPGPGTKTDLSHARCGRWSIWRCAFCSPVRSTESSNVADVAISSLDDSRNRTRRWCSMDDCGTDEKKRRYVATRRAAGTSHPLT